MRYLSTLMRVAAVAALVCIGSAVSSAKTLYLRSTSAPDVAVALGDVKQISFGDQNVSILLTDNTKVECALSEFRSLRTTTSGTPGQSGVESLNADAAEGVWAVYDINGRFISNATDIANGLESLPSKLGSGVYIVKSQSQTLKLIVR